MSRYEEIKQIVITAFAQAGMSPTEYGIQQAIEECAYFDDKEGRDPNGHMHYIINQAIPDGDREGWITEAKDYVVGANGHTFGTYRAYSAQEARDLCAQDAGYESEADMEEKLGQSSELVAELA